MRPSEFSPEAPRPWRPPLRPRKHRRFNLEFPVCLSFPFEGGVRELKTVSANVSVGGLLLTAIDAVPLRTRVNLVMEVKGPWSHRPVRLVAKGQVVRVEALGAHDGFAIAVECQRPLTEMKGRLAAAS